MQLLTPLVWLINRLTNTFISLLGFDPNKNRDDSLDSEELKSLVDLSGHKISNSNQGMLRAILDLDNMTVEDIMIPRNEVSGLDLEENIDILMEQILSCSTPDLFTLVSIISLVFFMLESQSFTAG